MELNKLKTLHGLLKEFNDDYADDFIEKKQYFGIMAEIDECIKYAEYKMMLSHMSEKLEHCRNGYISDKDFHNATFTLSFMHKTIQIGNNADVFDAIQQILKNEIDTIERGY